MKTKRKTFNVAEFRQYVNEKLGLDTLSQDEKKTLCFMLEGILHKTGNYEGFNYIAWLNGGYEKWCSVCEEQGQKVATTPFLGLEYNRRYH